MYRRPKFLEILLEIREHMSRDVDYDVDLFAEMVRSGQISEVGEKFALDNDLNEQRKKTNYKKKRSNGSALRDV